MIIRQFRWLYVVAWMILIFIGSSIPLEKLPDGPQFLPVLAHLIEYSVLAVLLLWSLNQGFSRSIPISVCLAAALVAFSYAILDEFHQLFVPGRVSDPRDLAVDGVGILLALIITQWLVSRNIQQRGTA